MKKSQIDITLLWPIFLSISIFLVWHHLNYLLGEQGRPFSSSQSSNFPNPVQCTWTCLVSSCLRLSHGKFEDASDDFCSVYQNYWMFIILLFLLIFLVFHICLCRGKWYSICIKPRLPRCSLSERPSNSSGVFRLYRFFPFTYLSLGCCFGSYGIIQ